MDIVVSHPAFVRQRLAVRAAGILGGARLLLNGSVLKSSWGRYTVKSDTGNEAKIQLRTSFVDPVPVVKIDDEIVRLIPPLRWYEYAWIGIPALLIFAGGALGALIGVAGAYSNSRVFRSDRSTVSKYALTGLTTIAAAITFLIAAVALRILIRRS